MPHSRFRFVSLLAAFALLWGAGFAPAEAEQKIAAAGKKWRWVENPRFEVLTNGPERRAREAIDQLESFRATVAQLTNGQIVDPPQPIRVLLFDQVWDFAPYMPPDYPGRPETLGGYLVQLPDTAYFALLKQSIEEIPRRVLAGYSSLLLSDWFRSQPHWFYSGLTEYLSAYRYLAHERRAEIGRPIPEVLQYLKSGSHFPLQRVLEMSDDSPEFARDVPRALFGAKSWLLVHYLQVGAPERAGTLRRFAQYRAEGMRDIEALEKAAGCTIGELDDELTAYQKRSLLSYQSLVLPEDPEKPETRVRPAETADALFRLGEYLQTLGPGREGEARAHFAAAGRPEPPSPWAVAQSPPIPALAPEPVSRIPRAPSPPPDPRSLDELRAAVAAGDATSQTKAAFARRMREQASGEWETVRPDLELARQGLREAVLESPRDEGLWRDLTALYAVEGEPSDLAAGVETFGHGVELAPNSVAAAYGLVRLLIDSDEDARAREAIEAARARGLPVEGAELELLLIDLDGRAAARLLAQGKAEQGEHLLEQRLAGLSSPNSRARAEAALAAYRQQRRVAGVQERYAAAVALVNAQKVEEGAQALRDLIRDHPGSMYADLARADLERVEAYLARRRARKSPSSPPNRR